MRFLPNILIVLFFLVRYPLQETLYSINEWGTYFFEIFFIILTLVIFRKNRGHFNKLNFKDLALLLLAFGFGISVRGSMNPLGLYLPWALDNWPDIIMLLAAGPILEELLYRQAFWILIEKITKNTWAIIATTTLLFALGHLYPYMHVDPFFKTFVLYQTTYTLILGLLCGSVYSRGKNILSPILIHIVFNLGFYLAHLAFPN